TLAYAGFAVVVAALLWTYFGWLILLAGAQLSFYVQNPAYLRLGLQPLRLSAAELEELSLRLMYFVGRAHAAGSRLWSVSRLAATAAASSRSASWSMRPRVRRCSSRRGNRAYRSRRTRRRKAGRCRSLAGDCHLVEEQRARADATAHVDVIAERHDVPVHGLQ